MLTEYVYTRNDEGPHRNICWPVINQVAANLDRATGNRSAFWDERNYMPAIKAGKLKTPALIAHGNNDNNVMTKNPAQLYEELKKQGIGHQFYFHQGGHGGSPPDFLLNLWFTKYLWGQDNGVESAAEVVGGARRRRACPPRESTVTGEVSNSATLTVASAAPFRVGYTLTIPQTNANGTITSTTRVITNIAGNVPDAGHAGRDDRRAAGRQRRAGEPGLQHVEPDAVRRVAGPDGGRLDAAARWWRRRARRARLRPGRGDDREADRRRGRRRRRP